MTNFNIIKLHNGPYNYLIIATRYDSSLSNIDEINNLLEIEQGKVLFDFMVVNGNKNNRFIECEVINSNYKRETCKLAETVDEWIKRLSSRFFIENAEVLESSVLPNALKYLIINGEVI